MKVIFQERTSKGFIQNEKKKGDHPGDVYDKHDGRCKREKGRGRLEKGGEYCRKIGWGWKKRIMDM